MVGFPTGPKTLNPQPVDKNMGGTNSRQRLRHVNWSAALVEYPTRLQKYALQAHGSITSKPEVLTLDME